MDKSFYAVGIGASAGGQQALSQFFGKLDPQIEVALIVVTHLMRDRPSILSKILSVFTRIPVHKVTSDIQINPGNVYVLAENTSITVENGWLKVKARDEKIENSSVDIFLSSLADDFGDKAIGIILSGGGHDGLEGSLKINRQGGKTLAQDPLTSLVDGMPRSIIEHDHPSAVASAADLAELLNGFFLRKE
ncbi:MAG: chemotaxis protein CheB [Bacteroidota bacterium]